MRSKTCQFQYIFKYRNTELLLLFSIITPWFFETLSFRKNSLKSRELQKLKSENTLGHTRKVTEREKRIV